MAYVELSHVLSAKNPNYPGSPVDALEPHLRQIKGDDCNTSMIHHFAHNGTHLDAPFHFDSSGKTVESIPLSDLIFETPAS